MKCKECKSIKNIGSNGMINIVTQKEDIFKEEWVCKECWPESISDWEYYHKVTKEEKTTTRKNPAEIIRTQEELTMSVHDDIEGE